MTRRDQASEDAHLKVDSLTKLPLIWPWNHPIGRSYVHMALAIENCGCWRLLRPLSTQQSPERLVTRRTELVVSNAFAETRS